MTDDNDDLPPELEDFSEELSEIRKKRGNIQQDKEIKVNVIDSNKNDNNNNNNNNNNISIPINVVENKKTEINSNNNNTNNNKTTTSESKKTEPKKTDNFGGGFFKKGFFKRMHEAEEKNKKNTQKQQPQPQQQNKNQQQKPEDLTYIKSTPETSSKTSTLKNFSSDLKTSEKESSSSLNNNPLLSNIVNNKNEWLTQELLMKIAQKPNLMKTFLDPRFSSVIKELQTNPQECIKKYKDNEEFSNFIREFSSIMGEHFTNLSQKENFGNNMNDPEVQKVINDPKINPILKRLQLEGKIDVEEINRDPYIAEKIKFLIDKKILNLQKLE